MVYQLDVRLHTVRILPKKVSHRAQSERADNVCVCVWVIYILFFTRDSTCTAVHVHVQCYNSATMCYIDSTMYFHVRRYIATYLRTKVLSKVLSNFKVRTVQLFFILEGTVRVQYFRNTVSFLRKYDTLYNKLFRKEVRKYFRTTYSTTTRTRTVPVLPYGSWERRASQAHRSSARPAKSGELLHVA